MKNFILIMLLLVFFGSAHAQKVIRLDELKMTYDSEVLRMDPSTNLITLKVTESYAGEFLENPLSFVNKNFNINQLLEVNRDLKYDTYDVLFNSAKGSLRASYNKKGNMIRSISEFKNVRLPYHTMLQVLKEYKDWNVVKTKHITVSKNWDNITRDFYRVKLANGKKSKTLKIDLKDSKLKPRVASTM